MKILHRGEDELGRRVELLITYEGQDISLDISDSIISLNHRDTLNEFDTLELTLHDRKGDWIGGWLPQKGEKLDISYSLKGWSPVTTVHYLGSFFLDSISYSGPPDVVSLKAISVNLESNIMDGKKNKSWENVTLKKIAEDISKECEVELMYDVEYDKTYSRVQQKNESDITLLKRLCQETGVNIKLYSDKIILFEESKFEKRESIFGIYKNNDCTNYSFSLDDNDTYDACEISFLDYFEDKVIKVMCQAGDRSEYKNKTNRILFINEDKTPPGEGIEQKKEHVLKIAQKSLREKNKNATTGNLEIMGRDELISSGDTIDVYGFGRFDGKYFVTEITTDFDLFKQSLGIRKCLEGY
ncbi:MAG: phage late control D family protein [Fusobacteriaceae bacterium]